MPIQSPTPSSPSQKQVTFSGGETSRTVKEFDVRDPVSALHLPRTAVINLPTRTTDELSALLEKQLFVVTSLRYNFNHVRGSVYVKNLSFHKEVSVRYTFDNWRTGSDRRAQYKGPVSQFQRGLVDEFIFEIDLQTCSKPTSLLFALRYSVNGHECWDNNNGKDYLVEYTFVGHSRNVSKFHMPTKPINKTHSPRTTENSKDLEQFDVPKKKGTLFKPHFRAHTYMPRCPSFDTYVAETTFENTFQIPSIPELTYLF